MRCALLAGAVLRTMPVGDAAVTFSGVLAAAPRSAWQFLAPCTVPTTLLAQMLWHHASGRRSASLGVLGPLEPRRVPRMVCRLCAVMRRGATASAATDGPSTPERRPVFRAWFHSWRPPLRISHFVETALPKC